MDILDLLTPKSENYVFSGTYRRKKKDRGQYFQYSESDYPALTYGETTNNISTTQNRIIIRTRWNLDFCINGYVVTQDGRMWIIEQVQSNSFNAQNLRFMQKNPNSEYILSLVGVNNPMGVQ